MSAATAATWVDVLVSWKGLGALLLLWITWGYLCEGIAKVVAAARSSESGRREGT